MEEEALPLEEPDPELVLDALLLLDPVDVLLPLLEPDDEALLEPVEELDEVPDLLPLALAVADLVEVRVLTGDRELVRVPEGVTLDVREVVGVPLSVRVPVGVTVEVAVSDCAPASTQHSASRRSTAAPAPRVGAPRCRMVDADCRGVRPKCAPLEGVTDAAHHHRHTHTRAHVHSEVTRTPGSLIGLCTGSPVLLRSDEVRRQTARLFFSKTLKQRRRSRLRQSKLHTRTNHLIRLQRA